MGWADTGRKNSNIAGGAATLTVTLNSTVVGNFLVAGCSAYNALADFTSVGVTDDTGGDGGNTWNPDKFQQVIASSDRQVASIHSAIITLGGNRSVIFDPVGPANCDFFGVVHEFSGQHATPADGATPTGATGITSDTADTGSLTPQNDNALVVAMEGHGASGTITPNQAPGNTDFIQSAENESGSGAEPGSMMYKIISGAPVAQRHIWTLGGVTYWATVMVPYKPAVVGPANQMRKSNFMLFFPAR